MSSVDCIVFGLRNRVLLLAVLVGSLLGSSSSSAEELLSSSSSCEQRVAEHNELVLKILPSYQDQFALPIIAKYGEVPFDHYEPLQGLLAGVGPNNTNSDFPIVVLVRILFLANGTEFKGYYDDLILPALQSERYWYTTDAINDDKMNSENHMILWMSSAWLLQEHEVWDMADATLRQRLAHYLTIKIEYGYYEFLSITYWPFTFAGLMNLVDFCVDEEIRVLAEGAVRRLVAGIVLFVNDKGIHYSAAGRDYAERFFEEPHSLQQDAMVYLLTGLGRKPNRAIGFSSFLSTSSFDFCVEVSEWQSSADTTYIYGHTLEESFIINAELGKYDRTVFQWSQGSILSHPRSASYHSVVCLAHFFSFHLFARFAGAYFHPDVAADTVDFLQHYGPIWFKGGIELGAAFIPFPELGPPQAAKLLKRLTVGSVLSGNTIRLYRQAGSMLSSVEDFWPGYVGYQTWPWMAVADDVPVWTQSGEVHEKWLDKRGSPANSHLPSVLQEGNIAMIVYKPLKPMPLGLLADVALNWPQSRFNETKSFAPSDTSRRSGFFKSVLKIFGLASGGTDSRGGSWILGRRDDSYVAVFRPCGNLTEKGWFACNGVAGRQVWAAAVGDATRYGSFDKFALVIGAATIEESVRWRLLGGPAYVTTLNVEGTSLHHEW
jgi:hypothetical protein